MILCRMSALAATALTLGLAGPAWSATPMAPAAVQPPSQALPQRARATDEERRLVARLEPLARAAFWAREAELDPRDAQAGVGLAQALRTMGNFTDAAEAAGRVLVTSPDNIEALLESARAHIGAGAGFYAIEPARHAQTLAPKDWRPVALLAVAYEQVSRDEDALAAHKLAVSLAPNDPAPLSNLALWYAGHGQASVAEDLLRTAITKPGATIAMRQNLTLLLGLQGRFDEAEKLARQDLPPEAVANNMAYLKAAFPGATGTGRSWDSVRTAQ